MFLLLNWANLRQGSQCLCEVSAKSGLSRTRCSIARTYSLDCRSKFSQHRGVLCKGRVSADGNISLQGSISRLPVELTAKTETRRDLGSAGGYGPQLKARAGRFAVQAVGATGGAANKVRAWFESSPSCTGKNKAFFPPFMGFVVAAYLMSIFMNVRWHVKWAPSGYGNAVRGDKHMPSLHAGGGGGGHYRIQPRWTTWRSFCTRAVQQAGRRASR